MSGAVTRKLSGEDGGWLREEPLARLLGALNGNGEEARVVGGAVRNTLLGMSRNEIDVATTSEPKETIARVTAAGFRAVPTGIEHGTVTAVLDKQPFEVTTLREDIETDGRHATVRFGRDWKKDAERRDFTINALSVSPDGTLYDYCGGMEDIAARRVRFIGDADTRIAEDYLRVLRFFRFFAAYGEGEPDVQAMNACARARNNLGALSGERLRAEVLKLLAAKRGPEAMVAMADTGVFDRVFSNASAQHALLRLADIEAALEMERDPVRRLAAVGVRIIEDADRLRERLRLSNSEYRRLTSVADGWWLLSPERGEAYARETLYRIGTEAYLDRALIAFAHADASLADEGWGELLSLPARWTPPKFPLSADDFLARGVAKGPELGRALGKAETAWIAEGFPEDANALKRIADSARG